MEYLSQNIMVGIVRDATRYLFFTSLVNIIFLKVENLSKEIGKHMIEGRKYKVQRP